MPNPFEGIVEWYQGLPQAAQIGIPVVGAGAVYLIAKGGKGGVGTLVSGPYGSSAGSGGGLSDSSTNSTPPIAPTSPIPVATIPPGPYGSNVPSGGASPGGVTTVQPVAPSTPSQVKPSPKPAGTVYHTITVKHVSSPTTERMGSSAPVLGRPHLPSSHISSPYIPPKPHLASSHISSYPTVTPKPVLPGHEAGPKHGPSATPRVQNVVVTPSGAKHPVQVRTLANRVPATKTYQHTNDRNKAATVNNALKKVPHQAVL